MNESEIMQVAIVLQNKAQQSTQTILLKMQKMIVGMLSYSIRKQQLHTLQLFVI